VGGDGWGVWGDGGIGGGWLRGIFERGVWF